MVPQRLREGVVLLLGTADPGDAVEEKLVVVPRRQPPQLSAWTVQEHGPQAADLAVDTVGMSHICELSRPK
ncbi:hypothetical protein GCM10023191_054970 [Actinoallomurus oryzae]|uniref:Uncharacterized protein n=1 Tax=Actinoallomurus oryzae TaxID=502180 RepID=A0ABP8QHZ6_9ACTN